MINFNFRFVGISEHVFEGHLQANPTNLQSCPHQGLAPPRKHRAREGPSTTVSLVQSRGGTQDGKRTWTEKTQRCW